MASTVVNAGALHNLANKMDELSHRAQDVLQRYEDIVEHANSAQIFNGSAGMANLSTTAQVKEAQMKIQSRFQSVNDLLRQGASTYTNHDETNTHQVHAVASSLKFT